MFKNLTQYKTLYIQVLKEKYQRKQDRNLEFSKNMSIVKNNDNSTFQSLYGIIKNKQKVQNPLNQVYIDAVAKVFDFNNGIVCFTTVTIDPVLNLSEDNYNNFVDRYEPNFDSETDEQKAVFGFFDDTIKNQYKVVQNFYKSLSNSLNHAKLPKTKRMKVLELTKNLNIHTHNIIKLKNQDDLEKYINSIFHSRKNLQIGEIEIAISEEFVDGLLNSKMSVRLNNKTTVLTFTKLDKNGVKYKINESEKSAGNFISIKKIQDSQKDRKHMTKYLFKYLLKTSNNSSNETYVFSHLGFRQTEMSNNFFFEKLENTCTKDELLTISQAVYREVKKYERGDKTLFSSQIKQFPFLELSKKYKQESIQKTTQYLIDFCNFSKDMFDETDHELWLYEMKYFEKSMKMDILDSEMNSITYTVSLFESKKLNIINNKVWFVDTTCDNGFQMVELFDFDNKEVKVYSSFVGFIEDKYEKTGKLDIYDYFDIFFFLDGHPFSEYEARKEMFKHEMMLIDEAEKQRKNSLYEKRCAEYEHLYKIEEQKYLSNYKEYSSSTIKYDLCEDF